jgi:YcxB-like protein
MAAGELPTVTFSLTEEDLFCFLMFHSLHEQRRLTWGGYFAAIAFTFVMVAKEGQIGMAVGFAVALAIILIPTYRWSLRRAARRMMRESEQLVGENTRVLSPEGVLETGAWGEATLNWNAFDRIVETPDYIYLYRSPRMAEIIPRRAFRTPEAAEAFLQAAKAWHAAASPRPR